MNVRANAGGDRTGSRTELLMLVLASLACVVVLVLALSEGRLITLGTGRLNHLLALAVLSGAGGLAVVVGWRFLRDARHTSGRARQEAAQLRRSLVTAEAIIKAEPQVLVFWEQGQGPRIIAHTLTSIAGLPEEESEFLKFGRWLEGASASELDASLNALCADGRSFNLLLRTQAGGHVEADGRAAAGRAVLRMRDVAGYKRDLVRILDQHRSLARDIRAMRALLNALPMPSWLASIDGKVEWANRAYVDAVEASDEQEVRNRGINLLETGQLKMLRAEVAEGRIYRERVNLIIRGERKAHNVVAVPLDGACAVVALDVAALETAQGEHERQIAAYHRTLDRVASAVSIFKPEGQLTFYNTAFHRLWRLDPDWLNTGPTLAEILDRLRERSRLPEAVNYREWKTSIVGYQKATGEHEDWWHLPDGRTIHLLTDQRTDGGSIFLFDDATERLERESRYNAMIDVQRETLDNLKEGVGLFSTDGRLKLYNSAFAQIWKLSRQLLDEEPHIDEIIRQCRILHDEPRAWQQLGRVVTDFYDQRQPVQGSMQRADASVIDFAARPLPDGATLITFADVTDSKRYERALIERNDALVAADKLKSQFISHVSYELRTPLTNIIGFTELLASPHAGKLNLKQEEYLGDISSSSRMLLSVIDDILDLTSIDAGALELKLGPVDLRSIISTAVQAIGARAEKAKLKIEVSVADDLGMFVGDAARVRQVLYNLLSNAVGFSQAGGAVRIMAWRESETIAFSVEDEGVGIPYDRQRKVLERFESHSQGSKHRGAGLGLAVVKSLVELHGGTTTLESEPGVGTRVTVRLPMDADNKGKTPTQRAASAA